MNRADEMEWYIRDCAAFDPEVMFDMAVFDPMFDTDCEAGGPGHQHVVEEIRRYIKHTTEDDLTAILDALILTI